MMIVYQRKKKAALLACMTAALLAGQLQPVVYAALSSKGDSVLTYTVNEDQTLTVTGCNSSVTWLDLTESIDGKVISKIDDYAFFDCSKLQAVVLGDNIISIGDYAFAETALQSVAIPATCTDVGTGAFSGCEKLTEACIFSKHDVTPAFGMNVFADCDALQLYCAKGSGAAAYAVLNEYALKQSSYYWVDELDAADAESETETVSETTTETGVSSEPATESIGSGSSGNGASGGLGIGNGGNSGGSSGGTGGGSGNSDSGNVDAVDPAVLDEEQGLLDGNPDGVYDDPGTPNDESVPVSYHDLDATDRTYVGGEEVYSPKYGSKIVKGEPPYGPYDVTWHEERGGYVFDASGKFVTKSDYIVLCNCVANEYGSDEVPVWEMALVTEVIFNRYKSGDYASLWEVIAAPGQFEFSETYIHLDGFSHKVTNRVIEAVNLYLSYPKFFNEGYMEFRGDGTWNYFW